LGGCGVSPGNVEGAGAVVADFADSELTFRNRTTMAAGEAADAIVAEIFVEMGIGFLNLLL
jgi:hypothetical protein